MLFDGLRGDLRFEDGVLGFVFLLVGNLALLAFFLKLFQLGAGTGRIVQLLLHLSLNDLSELDDTAHRGERK